MTSTHPFIPHYEESDETKRNAQHDIIREMYYVAGRNIARTAANLVTLGWNEKEASQAVKASIGLM